MLAAPPYQGRANLPPLAAALQLESSHISPLLRLVCDRFWPHSV
jgi:hypothetical protein